MQSLLGKEDFQTSDDEESATGGGRSGICLLLERERDTNLLGKALPWCGQTQARAARGWTDLARVWLGGKREQE